MFVPTHLLRTRLTTLVTALAIAALIFPGLATMSARAAGTADLAVTMTPSAKHLRYQQSMTIEIVVTNLGPDTATDVWLSTNVSDSLNPGDIVCPDRTTIRNYELCESVTLSPGQTATYLMTVIACCTCCPNRVGVSTAIVYDDGTSDPVENNNVAQLSTRFIGKFLN